MVEHSRADSEMQHIFTCIVNSDHVIFEQHEALEKIQPQFPDVGQQLKTPASPVRKNKDEESYLEQDPAGLWFVNYYQGGFA